MTIKEAITHLINNYEPNDHCAMHLWVIKDIKDKAEEEKIELSDEECNDILDNIHHHIDSEYGITWETIRCYIQDYKRK